MHTKRLKNADLCVSATHTHTKIKKPLIFTAKKLICVKKLICAKNTTKEPNLPIPCASPNLSFRLAKADVCVKGLEKPDLHTKCLKIADLCVSVTHTHR